MKNYAYFSVIRHCNLQLLDILNDIQVRRYDKNGNVIKTIGRVPLRFGPKSKIWNWISQRNFDAILPQISLFFQGIELDTERLAGLHSNLVSGGSISTGLFTSLPKPTPYDLIYKATIWTKYFEDLNQILENILPYFQPYIEITIQEPVTNDLLNFKVQLDGATSTGGEEYEAETRRVITWDLDFRVKALLFKYVDENGDSLIKKVLIHYWSRDATVNYSIDGTSYWSEGEDIALTVTTDATSGSQPISQSLDINGGEIDWKYSIYEPPQKYPGYEDTTVKR